MLLRSVLLVICINAIIVVLLDEADRQGAITSMTDVAQVQQAETVRRFERAPPARVWLAAAEP